MTKIFISYCHDDDRKKEILSEVLKAAKIEPIIVASRSLPTVQLSKKVSDAILEADYLIPILTKQSLSNQWVNQEIGFAQSRVLEDKIKIIPIVENSILDILKGFIHKQIDLPYNFDTHVRLGNENKFFKTECKKLVKNLDKEIRQSSSSKIVANINNIYLNTINNLGEVEVDCYLVLENNGKTNILINEIELVFEFSKTSKLFFHFGITEIIFRSYTYLNENDKRIELRFNGINLSPSGIIQIKKLKFFSTNFKVPIMNIPFFRNEFTSFLKDLNQVNSIFKLHSGDRINTTMKIVN